MNDSTGEKKTEQSQGMRSTVKQKVERKLTAREQRQRNVWFGLGMFGLIGWSIAVPTLMGIVLGLWIDRTWPTHISWTITLLFVGVVVGCWQAWQWIKRESRHE